MTVQAIPPKNFSNYRMDIEISGVSWILKFYFNSNYQFWSVSFYDIDENPILVGRKVNNYSGLIRYLRGYDLPGGEIVPLSENNSQERINQDDFVNRIFELVHISEDEYGTPEPRTFDIMGWNT